MKTTITALQEKTGLSRYLIEKAMRSAGMEWEPRQLPTDFSADQMRKIQKYLRSYETIKAVPSMSEKKVPAKVEAKKTSTVKKETIKAEPKKAPPKKATASKVKGKKGEVLASENP